MYDIVYIIYNKINLFVNKIFLLLLYFFTDNIKNTYSFNILTIGVLYFFQYF